jgi:hypothetical protein
MYTNAQRRESKAYTKSIECGQKMKWSFKYECST